jgi:hypothetical protein
LRIGNTFSLKKLSGWCGWVLEVSREEAETAASGKSARAEERFHRMRLEGFMRETEGTADQNRDSGNKMPKRRRERHEANPEKVTFCQSSRVRMI